MHAKAHLHFQPSHAVASGILIAKGCCIGQWGLANSWKGTEWNSGLKAQNSDGTMRLTRDGQNLLWGSTAFLPTNSQVSGSSSSILLLFRDFNKYVYSLKSQNNNGITPLNNHSNREGT